MKKHSLHELSTIFFHQTDHHVSLNPPQIQIPAHTLQSSMLYSEWAQGSIGFLCQEEEMTYQHHSYTNIDVHTGLIGQICELACNPEFLGREQTFLQ